MEKNEKENKLLKEEIKEKSTTINKLNEKIKSLPKKQIIEHKTVVEDEEFNLLVDENEDLKNVNKDLVNKINALKKQMKILNNNQNDINTNKLKEEISILNKKYNKICSELNQYKEKNSQLSVQIRNMKNGHK